MTNVRGPERVETVVIGAGQAGLAVGYHLRRRDGPDSSGPQDDDAPASGR
jgi:cation diffusion facilitator CzcD-associated flavoprotein CzcO